MLAFEDETWLELKPLIRATWMERVSQRKVLTPGINRHGYSVKKDEGARHRA